MIVSDDYQDTSITLNRTHMIKIVKLITSEEVVGEIEEHANTITIKKPCAIMLINSRSSPDQHSMALIPYAGYTKDHEITVDKKMIVWESELAEDVYNQYNAIFGTGIQIVTAK
jgi:hypothetical protein